MLKPILVAIYLSAAFAFPAAAQLQTQGMSLGSQGPMSGAPAPAETARQKRARCTKEARAKKLKGAKLRANIADCVKS